MLSVRLFVSTGMPRGLPLGPCRLETRPAARFERDHPCRPECPLGHLDTDETAIHLGSSLLWGAASAPVRGRNWGPLRTRVVKNSRQKPTPDICVCFRYAR